jgi:hypothetical protein
MPTQPQTSASNQTSTRPQSNNELIEKLAEKVYRLMLEDLKLSKLRGDTRKLR